MANERKGDWIMTRSGIHMWPLDPDPDEIEIRDIAHSLSMQCRWTGHVAKFYSVAEHSVHVSLLVPPEHALQALLHDASEAYLTDIARPVKPFLDNYYRIEDALQRTIYLKYGCAAEMAECVKRADNAMLSTEAYALMTFPDDISLSEPPRSDVILPCWSPEIAKLEFINRYYELIVAETW